MTDREPLYTYVVAGDYRQFINWCRENGRHPMDRFVRYVTNEQILYGVNFDCEFVFYGTWIERRDMVEIGRAIDIIRAKRG